MSEILYILRENIISCAGSHESLLVPGAYTNQNASNREQNNLRVDSFEL